MALSQRLGVGLRPLVVGVGRLVAQKDWPLFVAAAGLLPEPSAGTADLRSDPLFVVAGDGPLRAELVRLARQDGDRVRFLGQVDDIAALVGLATCVVFTSRWEGLPLALLEALSLGVPVVTTAVDGVPEAAGSGAALLVPPGDPLAVSAALARVLTDHGLAAQLGRRALAAAQLWRPERMLASYRQAYLDTLADA